MSNEAFIRWARRNDFDLGSYSKGYHSISTRAALEAWQARQPEIDALETENRRLSDSLEAIDLDTKILVDEIDALKAEVERLRKDNQRRQDAINITWQGTPKFDKTFCSQCGGEFGHGDHGYSHCDDHQTPAPEVEPVYQVLRKDGWDWDTVSGEEYKRLQGVKMHDRRILHPDNDGLRKAAGAVMDIIHEDNVYSMPLPKRLWDALNDLNILLHTG